MAAAPGESGIVLGSSHDGADWLERPARAEEPMWRAGASPAPPPPARPTPSPVPKRNPSVQIMGGRYEVRSELGRGAMGRVLRAWDPILERDVALKLLSEDLRADPSALDLFTREARSLAQLNHPNILTVHDFGQDSDDWYIVMEFVDGRTLDRILGEHKRLPLAEAVRIAAAVCEGLGFAHERKIIHRDIKPSNIMVTRTGGVKIADFGLARVVRELTVRKTKVSGTPHYMSPEQIRGTHLDFRTDFYALGCTFFEMLTGDPPFMQGEVLYHHVCTPPPLASKALRGAVDAEVDAVVLRAMSKNRDLRYKSAADFRRDLLALVGEA
jgi:serine/threonine-protein kinase